MSLFAKFRYTVICLLVAVASIFSQTFAWSQEDFQSVVELVQPKMVKINGSGGFRGFESYQSGLLISQEGHILTVWSYVLDSEAILVTSGDGQRHTAILMGYDPRMEIAILKIDANGLPAFNIDDAVEANIGNRVLAFGNLFGIATGDEPTSVLQGFIAAKTNLSARSGALETNYQGDVYVLDAMTNNPGAAGGAITDRNGQLIGMIGKELKSEATNTWLNFAIPISQLTASIHDIRSGKMVVDSSSSRQAPMEPMTTALLGFVLVPDVVAKTPPFIDQIVGDSVFDRVGVRTDDLIIAIGGKLTPSCEDVSKLLSMIDRDAKFSVTIQRDREFLTFEVQLDR